MRRWCEQLARWAGRWSPLVEIDGADGLRLDVSGVAHLFGDEDGLVDDIGGGLPAGLTVRVAIAPTAAAAWALARFGRMHSANGVDSATRADSPAKLDGDSPVSALRLDPTRSERLNGWG